VSSCPGIDGEVQREKFLSIHKAIAEREVPSDIYVAKMWEKQAAGLTGKR
jgi:hypothetical protein